MSLGGSEEEEEEEGKERNNKRKTRAASLTFQSHESLVAVPLKNY